MTDVQTTAAQAELPDVPPPFASADQAQARLAELQQSQEWIGRLMSGDPKARGEFDAIHQMIAGADDQVDRAIAGNADPVLGEVAIEGELSTRQTAEAITGLRELGLRDEVVAEAIRGAVYPESVVRQAADLKRTRMSDPEWTKKFLAGSAAERREMTLMNVILSGKIAEPSGA